MKQSESDKPTRTAPKGVWEGSIPGKKAKQSEREHLNEITTDSQGNGYPVDSSKQSD